MDTTSRNAMGETVDLFCPEWLIPKTPRPLTAAERSRIVISHNGLCGEPTEADREYVAIMMAKYAGMTPLEAVNHIEKLRKEGIQTYSCEPVTEDDIDQYYEKLQSEGVMEREAILKELRDRHRQCTMKPTASNTALAMEIERIIDEMESDE